MGKRSVVDWRRKKKMKENKIKINELFHNSMGV